MMLTTDRASKQIKKRIAKNTSKRFFASPAQKKTIRQNIAFLNLKSSYISR